MTSPSSVGAVSVEVLADARGLAKSMRAEVDKAFKGLDVGKAIKDSVNDQTIKLKVDPQVDTRALAAKLKGEVAAAARAAKATVHVGVDVDRKGAAGVLGGVSRSVLSGIADALSSIGARAASAAGSVVGLGGSIAGAANTASGPVGIVVTALAGLAVAIGGAAAAATVAVPAISTLAGVVASLPGLLAGAGAGFGTLALGFQGISEAFKKKPSGGGGGGGGEDPASRARRIAAAVRGVEAARRGIAAATRGVQSAERGLAEAELRVVEAQRRAAQAQQAINRARVDAKENLEDLNRSLAGAKLSEEDAALGVTEALRELNKAKESGVLPDIQRADLEYRQAIQTLEEAKDSTEDLGIEQADAAKKGIEGSDLVQGALADQAEALKAVKDAQNGVVDAQFGLIAANEGLQSSYDGLASAQDALAEANKKAASGGGAAGALGDVVKLAPAAQKFVNAIKALRPAFEDLRLSVQERLFSGLDKTVTKVGKAWIPALKKTLGSYADTFNGFFKTLGNNISTPKFIAQIQAGAEGFRKGMGKILDAVSGPLVKAFGTLSEASAPFLEALGEELAGVVTKFSEWVLAGEKSGGLQDFFEAATEAMHDIFDIGESVGKIIGNIIEIIVGRRHIGTDKTPLQQLNEGLKKVAEYLGRPEVQEGIRQFFEDIVDGIQAVGRFIKRVDGWITKIQTFMAVLGQLFGGGGGDTGLRQAGEGVGKALGGVGKKLGGKSAAPAKGAVQKTAGIGSNFRQAGDDAGQDFGGGFLEGLQAAVDKVAAAVPQLLWEGPDSLIGKIKSGLGIASPSTLTTEMGKELINGLIKGIGDKIEDLKKKAAELPGKIREGVGNAVVALVQKGKDFATGLKAGMTSAKDTVKTKAGELKTKVSDAFSNAGSFLNHHGKNLTAGLSNGMTSLQKKLGERAGGLRDTVGGAFSKAGSFLYEHGKAIIEGLKDGIRNKLPGFGQFLSSVGQFIKDHKGPIEKDRKLLFPEGAAIMDGLIGGVASKRDALGAEFSDLTASIGATSLPGLDVEADAAISRSLAVASANRVEIDFRPGFSGDWLVEGLRKHIRFSNNGRVDLALGSP